MNWVIRYSDKIKFHTHLHEVLAPLREEIKDYNWIITDVETGPYPEGFLINREDECFILSPAQFDQVLNADVQFYWGMILGVPKVFDIVVDNANLPFVEGRLIWKNGNIQYPEAELEIVCFDSSYTIVKFANEELSKKFHDHFPEAVELEKFSAKFTK
ncbi:hypothetical protein ACFGVR_09050 [Mucilaginibacter sp. AW1-3]